MNGMIISKWINYTSKESGCAPSVLIMLINMFLQKYPEEPCSLAPMYDGQKTVQTALVLIALICVPWMLFTKPFILRSQAKRKRIAHAIRNPRTISVPVFVTVPVPPAASTDESNGLSASNGGPSSPSANGEKKPDAPQEQVALELSHESETPLQAVHHYGADEDEEEEFLFGEVMIEQAIHTIE